MTPKIAQEIAQNLNHPKIINALNDYVDFRINALREELDTMKDDRRIHELQGAIAVLKQVKQIREHALAVVEVHKNGG